MPINDMGLSGYGTAGHVQQQIPQKKLGSKGTVSGSVLTDVQRFHQNQAAMIANYKPPSKAQKSGTSSYIKASTGIDSGRPHGSVN